MALPKVSLTTKIFIGLIAGILLGWLKPEWGMAVRPLSLLFLTYWYIVVNDKGQTPYFDFAGFYKTTPAWVTLIYAVAAIAFIGSAEVVHRMRLQE